MNKCDTNKGCHTILFSSLILWKHIQKKKKLNQVDNKNQIFIKYNFKITLKSDRSV